MNDDHGQPLAPDFGGLPMAVAQYETGSARRCELPRRCAGFPVPAENKCAAGRCQRWSADDRRAGKRGWATKKAASTGEASVVSNRPSSVVPMRVPDFHLLVLIRIRVVGMDCCRHRQALDFRLWRALFPQAF